MFALLLARLALFCQRKTWAYKLLMQAARSHQAPTLLQCGQRLIELGHAREALEPLRRTCVTLQDSSEACFLYAKALHLNGQEEEARPLYERALDLRPSYWLSLIHI